MDEKTWPIGLYAPGSYTCICSKCGAHHIADKRAQHCADCTLQELNTALAGAEKAAEAFRVMASQVQALTIEAVVEMINNMQIAHTSEGPVLEPRLEGNLDGLAYATALHEILDKVQADPPTRLKHLKRGSTYLVVGDGRLQTSRPLEDDAELRAYIGETDGKIWFRPVDEFGPDRFLELKEEVTHD